MYERQGTLWMRIDLKPRSGWNVLRGCRVGRGASTVDEIRMRGCRGWWVGWRIVSWVGNRDLHWNWNLHWNGHLHQDLHRHLHLGVLLANMVHLQTISTSIYIVINPPLHDILPYTPVPSLCDTRSSNVSHACVGICVS